MLCFHSLYFVFVAQISFSETQMFIVSATFYFNFGSPSLGWVRA